MALLHTVCLFLSFLYSLTTVGVRGDQSVEETLIDLFSNPGHLECSLGTVYSRTLPKGQTHVEHVIAIGLGVTQEDCTERCCRLGPSNCQYLWIFDDKCFAVSCNANPDSCQPISLGRTSRPIMTTYIKMNFSVIHDDPPIANVGPGKVIQLPQSEVYLYGNHSSDDHGIVTYHWDLLSSHQAMPQLQGTESDVLHVLNLLQGTYTFKLTVTDASGQSNSTTVTVKVNLGESPTSDGRHSESPTIDGRHSESPTIDGRHSESTTSDGGHSESPTIDGRHSESPTINGRHGEDIHGTSPSPGSDHPLPTAISFHPPSQQLSLPTETSFPGFTETGQTGLTETSGNGASATGNVNVEDLSSQEVDSGYHHMRNVLVRIVVPVLASVTGILIVSAIIVIVSACVWSNSKRMKKRYRYRKLPDTVEKA